ncbi:6003_t:CDS:2, partial [Scutellospora calospora]
PNNPENLTDIYDGRIWKTFQDPNEDLLFFWEELLDTIYTIICNLPRDEQFKPLNILTLALIPRPNKPKLHQLNHYLALLIDQLVDLWN